MIRALRLVVHNWPLKLAAIGLASLLYGGLVLSQSTATLTGVVPVDAVNQPADTFLLETIRPVTEIRYFSPSGVQPISSDFEASVDLSDVEAGAGPRSVPVDLRSVDPRVRVVDFQPKVVTVDLDRVAKKDVPVEVDRGQVPSNLQLGTVTAVPTSVQVVGPASVITRVVAARATVIIQPTGIDIDQDIELVPVDSIGDAVAQVKLAPTTARITIPVFSDRQSRTLPVSPQITGSPAAGFELASASVTPRFVTIEGDIDEIGSLTNVETAPISVAGVSSSRTIPVGLALPTGVTALDATSVDVAIEVRPVTATRTFEAGLRLIGAKPDLAYSTTIDRVLITVGGGLPDLDRLTGSTIVVNVDVADLGPGTTDVPVTAQLPNGVTLVVADPAAVPVTVAPRPSSNPLAPSGSG
ncbi:MAG TPA: CdaR family protein [Candidatus Limnocylindrales bacterium]|nr:CdaR family protein [Candidatus Limnocylindrales bacterium]